MLTTLRPGRRLGVGLLLLAAVLVLLRLNLLLQEHPSWQAGTQVWCWDNVRMD